MDSAGKETEKFVAMPSQRFRIEELRVGRGKLASLDEV